jgi:replication-associated recombination protein RarA
MTPRTLADIIGQPFPIARLQALVRQPHESCWLVESMEPGVGKTATAHCLAYDLGCEDAMSGLFFVPATRLTLDKATELLEYTLHHRPLMGRGWKVLILDELERLPSVQVANYLKSALDEYSLPPRTVVVATSNGAGNLEPALLQRFEILAYSSGPAFQNACLERIAELWQTETGSADMPPAWRSWGSMRGEFSMRLAMRALHEALRNHQELVPA